MSTDVATTPETEEKTCTKCKESKPVGEFFSNYRQGGQHRKASSWCKTCHGRTSTERVRHRRETEPGFREKERTYCRTRRFLKKYGMTPEDYEDVFEWQGRRCAICRTEANIKVLGNEKLFAVDHDHSTGQIRGLLCDPCNRGIGLLKDDPSILRQAADYLERNSGGGDSRHQN